MVGLNCLKYYSIDIGTGSITTNFTLDSPAHYFKQFLIYDFANAAMTTNAGQNLHGVSAYDKWKLAQPGFMNMNNSSVIFLPWHLKKEKDIAWDGTMNMPVIPIAD